MPLQDYSAQSDKLLVAANGNAVGRGFECLEPDEIGPLNFPLGIVVASNFLQLLKRLTRVYGNVMSSGVTVGCLEPGPT